MMLTITNNNVAVRFACSKPVHGKVIVRVADSAVSYPTLEEIKKLVSQLDENNMFIAATILINAKNEIEKLANPQGAPASGILEDKTNLDEFIARYLEQFPSASKDQAVLAFHAAS
jgi:hypothetical protein